MFFAGKKTVYLALYRSGQKIKSAGFLQISETKDGLKLTVQIKNVGELPDGAYTVCIGGEEESVQIGHIMLHDGSGHWEKKLEIRNNSIRIKDTDVLPTSIGEVAVILSGQEKISGCPMPEKVRKKKSEDVCAKVMEEVHAPVREIQAEEKAVCEKESVAFPKNVHFPKEEQLILPKQMPELLHADKWEQILDKYSNIHPFRDDRVFVSLKLQDLVILPEKYQRLVHNSFLLHGFYNYRHLILGRDYRLGNGMEKCFYLGVPGVYFEREKQVAVMFGFEGFECAGAVENGKFGYYVKEVSVS